MILSLSHSILDLDFMSLIQVYDYLYQEGNVPSIF